ncbi:MAG TPA: MFS transporter [Solimonas sp.]|nr:MFS transporter [Solimonas sp.]
MSLSRGLLFVFALPGILQAFMLAPAGSILQGVYAKESGIALTLLGTAIIVVRGVDLCSDLLIGYFSDRSMQRGISRKLWIAAGTVLSAVAMWFLFRPPPQVSVWYYGVWFLLANVGWSLVQIPYRSWSIEFSPEPNARARIVSWIAVASVLGGLLFYLVAPAGHAVGLLDSNGYDMKMLGLTAAILAPLLPLLSFYTLWRVPDQIAPPPPPAAQAVPRESFALLWKSVIGNGPLLRLMVCLTIFNFMTGMSSGVSLLYLTNYLLLPSSVNAVFAAAIPISMLGIPMWAMLVRKFDRQRVWALGMILGGIVYACMGLLPPKPSVALLTALLCLSAFFMLSALVAAPVIMGDIIDYGREKFGVERAGLYLSFEAQVLKGIAAVASGAGLLILGWAGFDAAKSGTELTPLATAALRWVAGGAPAFGFIGTGILLWLLPISHAAAKPAKTD